MFQVSQEMLSDREWEQSTRDFMKTFDKFSCNLITVLDIKIVIEGC